MNPRQPARVQRYVSGNLIAHDCAGELSAGVVYHNEEFELGTMLCACGCGHRVDLLVPDRHQVFYGVTPMRLSEIIANDDDRTWFVKFEAMAADGAGQAGWWKASVNVCIPRTIRRFYPCGQAQTRFLN
jgi:hypothetical protein